MPTADIDHHLIMKLEMERLEALVDPTDSQLKKRLLKLRSYGPNSYASLTDEAGNYLQVAGGGVTCMIEKFDVAASERLRAFHNQPSPVFPDGTVLAFSGGELALRADEWFQAAAVVDVFLCFKHGRPFGPGVHWREAPHWPSALAAE